MEKQFANISKRKTNDTIEIDGRTFMLEAFDPLLGNYILVKLLTFTLPFGLSGAVGEKLNSDEIKNSQNPTLSKNDFMELQKDILSCCYEILPSGKTKIINENGSYGIINPTMKIFFQLIIASLAFNFSDFFGEGGLTDTLGGLTDSFQPNTKM